KSGTQNLIDIENGSSDAGAFPAGGGGQSKTQLLLEEEHNLEQLHEREAAMRQLESDIVDVNTIFTDLATMVHDQGEIVDSIEANVESTQVRVSEGTEQLRQAEQYKATTIAWFHQGHTYPKGINEIFFLIVNKENIGCMPKI
ncbi:Syntaxin-12, partial [Caligus rogercresseyi]